MRRIKHIGTASALLILLLLSAVVSAFAANPVAVKEIKLKDTPTNLALNKSITLKTIIEPKNATDKKLVWTSSDDNVVTVKNGTITGTGLGTATITATAEEGNGVSLSFDITVLSVSSVRTIFI